jgi:hypothetical protein
MRDVVDEIVVAIDDTAPDTDLRPLEGIADTAMVAPFEWPLEANLEWLQSQCSGDWVLRLDGDEFASRALLDLLAGDEWHRGVTHSYVPRRWLVDDGSAWIRSSPWWPDPQLRFLRNDPDLVRTPREPHGRIDVTGPHKMLPAPIYHTDIIDSGLQVRRTKARRYLDVNRELRAPSGHAMTVYYTPELATPTPSVLPVPPDDRPLIDAAMTNVVRRHRPLTPIVNTGDRVSDQREAMSVTLTDPTNAGYSGARAEFLATVTNTGTEPLDPWGAHPMRLGGRWFRDGSHVVGEARADLPYRLDPGDSVTVLLPAEIPTEIGTYRLEIAGVAEGCHWLETAIVHRFESVAQPRIVVVGAEPHANTKERSTVDSTAIDDLSVAFPHALVSSQRAR